jgi:hypothetical protein
LTDRRTRVILGGRRPEVTDAPITQSEIDEFGDKLEAFARGLSPREQALFLAILAEAAANGFGDDVEGHAFDPGLLYLVEHSESLSWRHVQRQIDAVLERVTAGPYRRERHA